MLVEGGYLHSMKRIIEKAADIQDPPARTRSVWNPARLMFMLLGRTRATDRDPQDEVRRRELPNDPRRR